MEKDLLIEMGFDEEKNIDEKTDKDSDEQSIIYIESQINDLQLQVENSIKEEFEPRIKITTSSDKAIYSERLSVNPHSEKQDNMENECIKKSDENIIAQSGDKEYSIHVTHDLLSETNCSKTQQSICDTENDATYINNDIDTQSIRSVSTVTTIAPDEIKKRTRLVLDKLAKKSQPKRVTAKGEASAVTRVRRDNRATIKESTGIWGWE